MNTGYQIIEQALLKIQTPRVPCFPLIDIAFAAAYLGKSMREVQLNPRTHARALGICCEQLPVDGVYINLGLGQSQADRLTQHEYRIDGAVTLVIPENDVLSISSTAIDSLTDPRLDSAELFHPGIMETFAAIDQEIKQRVAVAAGVTGTFSQVAFLFGISSLMMALLDQPEAVKEALDRRHTVVLKQAREICAAGARFVWIGEGLGSGSLISPAQYREFVLPYEQSLAAELRACGALSLLHICGDVSAALPDIARCGADGFDLDYPVPLSRGLEILLPKVAVKGNINPALFLASKTEMQRACRQALQTGAGRAGFILSTGCLVPRDSDPRHFEMMYALCLENLEEL